jgi:ribosome-associated protein
MIEIAKGIFVAEDELIFKASRSSGPGGQNVNKVNTRIGLYFDVKNCPSLTALQKRKILTGLATRADKNGVVRIVSQKHRTQNANREAALEKLKELIAQALAAGKKRIPTKIPESAREKRLNEKRLQGKKKQLRGKINWRDNDI